MSDKLDFRPCQSQMPDIFREHCSSINMAVDALAHCIARSSVFISNKIVLQLTK